MAKFKSIPGSQIKGVRGKKFDAQGFLDTDDPAEIKILSGARYVEPVGAAVKAPATPKPEAKPEPKDEAKPAPKAEAPRFGKGGKK